MTRLTTDQVLAATDRFRLAVRELEWQPGRADVETAVLVPARTLSESAKTLGASDQPVQLAFGTGTDGLLGIVNGGRRTTTRLLDAEFPKFRQLLPKEHTSIATLTVSALTDAIKRVALVAERVVERVVERVSAELRLDPLEVRRRNFVRSDEFPYSVGVTFQDGGPTVYDSGDYEKALDRVIGDDKATGESFDRADKALEQAVAHEQRDFRGAAEDGRGALTGLPVGAAVVAVLDGAVCVLDANAGVEPQTAGPGKEADGAR